MVLWTSQSCGPPVPPLRTPLCESGRTNIRGTNSVRNQYPPTPILAGKARATISSHGNSSRRASTSSASSARGDAKRRSPSKKPSSSSSSSASSLPSSAVPSAAAAADASASSPSAVVDDASNPLVAMQTVIAGDLVPIKQRAKAAQQLALYFCELPTTPALFAYYESFLPVLASVVVAPIKAARDVQDGAVKLLKALGSHSPRQFVEWCALHVSMHPTQPPWYVDWCCGLLLAAETRVPRRAPEAAADAETLWDDRSSELQELDAATAAVLHLWRSVLDHADDEEIVEAIAVGVKALLSYTPGNVSAAAWRALVTAKIQPHFVDVADVLIGWAMSGATGHRLRDAIFALLEEMRELWVGNSVFCLQLLQSFASDIFAIYSSPSASEDDFGRLDSIVLCSTLVAQCIPSTGSGADSQLDFVEKLLLSYDPARFVYSGDTVFRLSDYLEALAVEHHDRFAPLATAAVRFLLTQVASQLSFRRFDMQAALLIVERASRLGKLTSSIGTHASDARAHARKLLTDKVVGGYAESDGGGSVLEQLLALKCFGAVKYTTQVTIQAVVMLGVEGLQLVAETIDRKLSTKQDSIVSFWVTCFIIACKDPRMLKPFHDGGLYESVSRTIRTMLQRDSDFNGGATSVHKLAPVFLTLTKRLDNSRFNASVCDLLSEQARVCVRLLKNDTLSPSITRELLSVLAWTFSAFPKKSVPPDEILCSALERLKPIIEDDAIDTRAECTRLLVAAAPLCANRAASAQVFQLVVGLIEGADESTTETLIARVLPHLGLAIAPSTEQQPQTDSSAPVASWKSLWMPSEFSIGDFELVYELLSQPDSSDEAWYRTCRRIQARLRRPTEDSWPNREALLQSCVREMAKWVVQNRLRTPLGPPSAIFSSVERMLQAHINYQRSTTRRDLPDHQWPVRVSAAQLVEFVHAMEIVLGVATDLKCPESNPESEAFKVQSFFRANVAVCEEWLSRIRPTVIELTSTLRQSESLMHHSMALVTALARKLDAHLQRHPSRSFSEEAYLRVLKQVADLETAVFGLAESLCGLRDPDTILGLQSWWASVLSKVLGKHAPSSSEWQRRQLQPNSSPSWLKAIALEAELKYEDAVNCYEAVVSHTIVSQVSAASSAEFVMHSMLAPVGLSLGTFVGCVKRCGRCYASLRRWSELRELSSRCQEFAQTLAMKSDQSQALAGLQELCDSWRTEASMVTQLSLADRPSQRGFSSLESAMDNEACARAAASLEKWGALSAADQISIARTLQPDRLRRVEAFAQVSDALQLLRFRPAPGFADMLSPTSSRERESTLLLGALLGMDTKNGSLHVMEREGSSAYDSWEAGVDPTQWTRLITSSSSEQMKRPTVEWALKMARAARKHKNHEFAVTVLNQLYAADSSPASNKLHLSSKYEEAVLRMSGESCREGVLTLVRLCDSVLRTKRISPTSALSDSIHVRALLRLARTLANVDTGDQFATIEAAMNVMGSHVPRSAETGLVEYRNELVKMCLESATEISSSNPRTWYEFSKWCHHQGRLSVDKVASDNGLLELLPSEATQLSALVDELRLGGSTVAPDEVFDAFRRVMDGGSLVSNRGERLRLVVSSGASAASQQQDVLDRIFALHAQVVARLLHPIKLAAAGYRSFLHAADSSSNKTPQSCRLSSRITSVALRLLRMLTRFGSEPDIVGTVTDVFVTGPLAPWGRIVPQLLSRIGHAYSDVSAPVATLLMRLARRYPHLVVYPAIVEAGRRHEADMAGTKLLHGVVTELRERAPDLADGVGRMVNELKRISILWDDAWIWALVKMSGDVNRRISTLEKEASRVEMNSSLSVEEKAQLAQRKAVAIMTPVLVAVERLWIDTLGRAVPGQTLTPHEKQFVHKYSSTISTAIQVLRSYCSPSVSPGDALVTGQAAPSPGSPMTPSSVWQPFADLLKSLAAASGRRERIDLAEISPILARISPKSKAALMPGSFTSDNLNLSSSQMITVTEISRNVVILRTKTKPKCLKFIGSDGQAHRYLLKAREDLHLDERVMQFLGTVNEFLGADRSSSSRNLRARNYSVVPLSSDAGLIQMVPEVLPLFQIYTNRLEDGGGNVTISGPAAAAAAAADPEQTTLPMQQPPTAPFYAKLKQYGVHDVSPSQRSRWPLSVLRRVHEDLVAARPANVINREMIVQSVDFADAWTKMYRFSRSTAVMSVLGYLVGLGDRHLDNMLLCSSTGELVHIDYNVCFDKGRKLKVPEVVPFRLTPIMLDALGLTGVDGVFRSAFANTLRVVRDTDSREALLALLDAFVYDPLADWLGEGKHQSMSRDSKQRMDVNVNLSLFLSRARERSQETTAFMGRLESALNAVDATLREAGDCIGRETIALSQQLAQVSEEKQLVEKTLAMVEKEWQCVIAARPQADDLDELRRLVEGDKTNLSVFSKECDGRREQILQCVARIRGFNAASTEAALSHGLLGGYLLHSHQRILSVAMRLPPSPSTPVWTNMLASLQTRCMELDQQLPLVFEKTSGVIRELTPLLHEYKERRDDVLARIQSVNGSPVDEYAVWSGRSSQALGSLKKGEFGTTQDMIEGVLVQFNSIADNRCSRSRHEEMIHFLKVESRKLEGMQTDRMTLSKNGDLDELVQQFIDKFSALKLSNSQTQRVLKLVCARWIVSQLDQLAIESGANGLRVLRDFSLVSQPSVTFLMKVVDMATGLRDLTSASKGSMKKALADVATRSPSIEASGRGDASQRAFANVLAIIHSLASIVSDGHDRVTREEYGVGTVASPARERSDKVAAQSLIDSARILKQTAVDFQWNADLSTLEKELVELSSRIQSAKTSDGVTSVATSFVVNIIVDLIKNLLHRVICEEWKLSDRASSLATGEIDKLALAAMPTIGVNGASPMSHFHACCETFEKLWAVRAAQSAAEAEAKEWQRRSDLVTELLGEHLRHVEFLDWNLNRQAATLRGVRTRGDMLEKVATYAQIFPVVYEEMGRTESSLLEVAQQLEYVASQISFSCTMGFAADEGELQGVCKDIRDLYSQVSRHFEAARTVADVAVAVSAVESSLKPVCKGENDERVPAEEMEVDRVGHALLQEVASHLDRVAHSQKQGEDASTLTARQGLEVARAEVQKQESDLASLRERVARHAKSVPQTEMVARLDQVVKAVNAAIDQTKSLGWLPGEDFVTEKAQPADRSEVGVSIQRRSSRQQATTRNPVEVARFALVENERLVKILHRSVQSLSSMQKLDDVLSAHNDTYQQLQERAKTLGVALVGFTSSARVAIQSSDIAQAVQAVGNLTRLVGSTARQDPSETDLLTGTAALLKQCCKHFFEAAELADELTKADDRAAKTLGGASADEDLLSADDNDIDGGLHMSDEGLDENTLGVVPLRPIAGFQEQNRYGVEVVARIDEKLSGVVLESGSPEPLSIDDQSSWLINAATNVDNLCVMYEGWTPWI